LGFGVWGLGHWGWGLLEYKSYSVGESLIALVEQLDQLVTTRGQGWLNNLVLSLVFNLIQYPKLSDYEYIKNI
jgi:hypothetical protein